MTDVPSSEIALAARPHVAAGRAIGSALLGQRVRPLWIVGGVAVFLFHAFRGALLLAEWEGLRNVGAGDVLSCFAVAMRYDMMPLGYILLPMTVALMFAPACAFGRRRFTRLVTHYAASAVVLVLTAETIGAAFFLHFGLRLNWIALDYLQHYREIGMYILKAYPVWLLPILMGAVYYAAFRAFRWAFWRGQLPANGRRRQVAAGVVLSGLLVLACRGGLDEPPVRRGRAYFSNNNLVNQLTMNSFFTFFYAAKTSLNDGRDETALYPFPCLEDSARSAAESLFQEGDVPLGTPANPLWRRSHAPAAEGDWNVVVILMEGMSGPPVGAMGNAPSCTPELDALCASGLFFDRLYAVGARTSRGMVGTFCGHPDLGGKTVMKRPAAKGRFLTLPDLFRARGYRTMFLYGGDPNFDNMKAFFEGEGGIDEVIGQEQMDAEDLAGNWGVPDEVIFRKAHERFERMGDRRFFAAILTVSNHEPYEIPPGRIPLMNPRDEKGRKLNAYRYADWALGEFFRCAATADYFARTVFVLVADHGRDLDQTQVLDVAGYRVPCLFYAPCLIPPGRVSTVGSQTDIAPTLLAMLGGAYEHSFFGRNLLAVQDEGFALLHEDDRLGLVRGDWAIVLPPRQRCQLLRLGPGKMERVAPSQAPEADARDMERRMLSLYRMARQLYLNGSYCPPQKAASLPSRAEGG